MIEDLTPAAIADSDVQTALVPVAERAALALASTKTEEHLKTLATKHQTITVIKDKAGREQAHNAAMELQKARTTIEKIAKEARDDATKFSKAVIAEEKRLIAITEAEEKRLFAVRDTWDAEQERIRQAKVLAEQQRVERINAAIASIAAIPVNLTYAKADVISAAIAELESQNIVEEFYEEFTDKAVFTRSESLQALTTLYGAASEREAEAKRIAEEGARLAAERAELDRQRRELEEATARAAAEAALAAQRALDEASAKAKREAEQREVFQKQQRDAFEEEKRAAEDLLAKQRAELAEQQAVIAAQIKAQRDAEEKARLAKEADERRAREDAALAFASRVVAVVAEAFEIEPEEAEEYITRAAATISANDKVTA